KALAICGTPAYGTVVGGYPGPQNTGTWNASCLATASCQGVTSITMSSTNNLQVGSIVFLDQMDDPAGIDGCITNGGWPATGDVCMCDSANGMPCAPDG